MLAPMLLWLEGLREHWLIWLAQRRDERGHLATATGWIIAQWTMLLYVAALAGAAFLLDRALFDRPHDPASAGSYGLLVPVLAAAAAAFVFVMTAWLSVTQSTAARFDSAAVVRRLADDWVGSFVLRLLVVAVFTAIVGLATPAITGQAVTLGAALPVVLLLTALPLLLALRRYALFLTHPGRFAEIIRSDTEQRIMRVSDVKPPTRSVAAHYRTLVSSDLEVWEGLLSHTASRDPALHAVIAHELGLTLAFYWNRKVAIDATSEWFPQHEVASEERDLRLIYAEQGLGQTRMRQRDFLWLEQRVVRALARAARRNDTLNQTRSDVLAVLKELLVLAWHRQETAALAELRRVWTAERTAARPEDYESWAEPVVNGLIHFAEEVLRHGLRRSEFLPLTSFPDRKDLAGTFMPAEVLAEMQRAADAIDNETALCGRTVTPLAALSREIERRLRLREEELTAEAVEWLVSEFRSQIERFLLSTAPGSANASCDLFGALLVICNRSYYIGSRPRAQATLAVAVDLSPRMTAAVARADDEKRLHIQRESRTIALKAIRDNWSEAGTAARLALDIAGAERARGSRPTGDEIPPWLETMLVVAGLAYAAGEVRADHTLVTEIIGQLNTLGLDQAARAALKHAIGRTPMLTLGASFTLEYHQYAVVLNQEAEKLGRTYERGPGEVGFDEVLNTQSQWLRTHSHFGFGVEDAIEGFLTYASDGQDEEPTSK